MDTQRATEEAARRAWELETEGCHGYSIATLRRVFDTYQTSLRWKDPFDAIVSETDIAPLMAAIEFFNADRATVEGPITNGKNAGKFIVSIRGYQAD